MLPRAGAGGWPRRKADALEEILSGEQGIWAGIAMFLGPGASYEDGSGAECGANE